MNSPITWRRLLALAVGIFPAAMAQICTPGIEHDDSGYTVSAQSDLDRIAAECTTVNGSVFIGNNYTGLFSLPNVQNITSGIQSEISYFTDLTPAPTSMDLPDLEYLGALSLRGLPTLTNFSAPKLKTVDGEVRMDYVQIVNLRSLEGAGSIRTRGNITSLQLDSLQYVRGSCHICNKDSCNRTITPITSLDLSLPSLQTTGNAEFYGRLSSLSVPKLSNATGYRPGSMELQLVTAGETINVSFPQLLSSRDMDIELEGDIASLSMPKIRDVGFVQVRSYVPLDINLPFQEAALIQLSGNISSIQFPNLKSLSTLIVESDLSLDCDSIEATISKATNISEYSIDCQSGESNLGSSLVFNANVAIGVVVAVIGLQL